METMSSQTVTAKGSRCVFRIEDASADGAFLVIPGHEEVALLARPSGVWAGEVSLPPGRHRYCFVLVEREATDPGGGAKPSIRTRLLVQSDFVIDVADVGAGGRTM